MSDLPPFDGPVATGMCPVEIEGTIADPRDGSRRQYYFRARGERVTLRIGAPNDASEFAAVDGANVFTAEIKIPFAAGHIPRELAEGVARWVLESLHAHWCRAASSVRKERELLELLEQHKRPGGA